MGWSDGYEQFASDPELTPREQEILNGIVFDLHGLEHEECMRILGLAEQLTLSLLERGAILEARLHWWTDPTLNLGGHGKSRQQRFEQNAGSEPYDRPHFLPVLRYWLFGPNLPEPVISRYRELVRECSPVTSGDITALCNTARTLAREHGLGKRDRDKFVQLAVDCGLAFEAPTIGEAIGRLRE